MNEVSVFADASEVARAAAEQFTRAATESIRQRGRFVLALSGGTTPRALYSLLATPIFAARIEWRCVHLYWSDERCVPPSHPDSNYAMVRDALLDHVSIPPEQVTRMHGETEPAAAASAYERELRATFATPTGPPRASPGACFDWVLLGMGADGHTASLFPGGTALEERTRWVVADKRPEPIGSRLSLTLPLINAAAAVTFLVVGADKARTLAKVLGRPNATPLLPAQRVRPRPGSLCWLVDTAAAAALVANNPT